MSEELTKNLPHSDLSRVLALLNSINERLAALEDKVDQLTALEDRLAALEDKVVRRLQDTRPIWEQVLSKMEAFGTQMEAFGTRMEAFEARMESFEARMENLETEMRSGFRKLDRQIGLLAEDVMIVRADQRDLERRMDKLESGTAR